MLKVERLSKQEIAISLRSKGTFFSPSLLRALFWAVLFHLGAFILFQVSPFSLTSGAILPPAFVESDLFDGRATAFLDQESSPKRYLLAPKESQPELPATPRSTLMEYFENTRENDSLDLFLETEQEQWMVKYFQPHGKSFFLPFELRATGPLSDRLFTLSTPPPLLMESFKAVYSIQVENRSGEVFWYEPKAVPPGKRQLVENVIRSLRFEPALGFTTAAEVEITFNQRRVHD